MTYRGKTNVLLNYILILIDFALLRKCIFPMSDIAKLNVPYLC